MPPHPELAHRGGLHQQVDRQSPDPTLFRRLGGRDTVARIVHGLYDGIHDDPVLRPMFRRDQELERQNQVMFFEEWFGGEPLYSRHRARVGLRLRHRHARIAPRDAQRWLGHFERAIRTAGVPDDLREEIHATLRPLATALVNDVDPTGPPDPDRHRCGKDPVHDAAVKAAKKGDVDAIRTALAERPKLLEPAWGSPSLLYLAATRGRVEVIAALVDAGADPATATSLDWSGPLATPLCGALQKRKTAAAELLRDLGARDDIFTAATLGDRIGVTRWLDAHPDLLDAPDPADDVLGLTPLYHAVLGDQPKTAALLLERGATVGERSHELVQHAAEAPDPDLLRRLLERGANATRIGCGRWVLDSELAPLLREHGADVNYEADPWSSWQWQSCTGNHAQKDDVDYVRALLMHGADPDRVHPYWRRGALHFAAKAGFAETVTALLAAGADVDQPDEKTGATPLFHAFQCGRSVDPRPVVRALLAAGADPEAQDRRNRTVRQAHPRSRAILDELTAH